MRIFFLLIALVAVSVTAARSKPLKIIAAFKKAGLKAEKPVEMEPKDFGLAPFVGEEAYRFGVPQVCSDCNGRIFSVSNTTERAQLVKYYTDLGKRTAALYSWVFERSTIVLQLNGDMKRAEAMKYKAVLDKFR